MSVESFTNAVKCQGDKIPLSTLIALAIEHEVEIELAKPEESTLQVCIAPEQMS